jgi:hypothetical protein
MDARRSLMLGHANFAVFANVREEMPGFQYPGQRPDDGVGRIRPAIVRLIGRFVSFLTNPLMIAGKLSAFISTT